MDEQAAQVGREAGARGSRWNRWVKRVAWVCVLGPVVYALSSGPVLAGLFRWAEPAGMPRWMAEGIMWVYYPLMRAVDLHDGVERVYARYLEWWCELFGTQIPG